MSVLSLMFAVAIAAGIVAALAMLLLLAAWRLWAALPKNTAVFRLLGHEVRLRHEGLDSNGGAGEMLSRVAAALPSLFGLVTASLSHPMSELWWLHLFVVGFFGGAIAYFGFVTVQYVALMLFDRGAWLTVTKGGDHAN